MKNVSRRGFFGLLGIGAVLPFVPKAKAREGLTPSQVNAVARQMIDNQLSLSKPPRAFSGYKPTDDLSDIIYSVEPTDTPFLSGYVETTPGLHKWNTDEIA